LRYWCRLADEALTDVEAIGRIDADHVAVLRRLAGDDQMREDERTVIGPVENYFVDQGKEIRVQITSGVYALTPEDYQSIDVDRMLDYARVAERRIRDIRTSGYEFYNPDQWEKGRHMADVINHLPSALESGYIQVWYQPQVDFETGEITGAEALCRWDHDKLGWLQPASFIPALEETGLIYDLDCYVWEQVARDLHRWSEQGQHRAVSVNLSRSDFREDRDIPEHFRTLVDTHGLTPDQLHVEITETAFAENPKLLIDTTERLRAYGFQVEMDDFGSGLSSLHMLKEVPVDRIKLDLHFLTESGDPEKGRIIVSHMIQMVKSLGMRLIAEGVETVEQANFLKSKGDAEMQGYYFYKPMPVAEFEKVMDA
jgi:EAL domain-containing protein (putative c-di-GMP-specific phosphodiesterase class I)